MKKTRQDNDVDHMEDADGFVDVLVQILIDQDHGKSVDRFKLLQQFPQHRERLMDYFETVEDIEDMAGPTVETFAGQIDNTSAELPPNKRPDEPEQVFGRYLILNTLGKGGMGTVYLAEDTVLNRKVALKIPRFPDEQSDMVERFYREAKAAAVIQHRNICPVFDIGRHQGQLYITMAYIEGKPLSDFINEKKLPSSSAVAKIIRKLALALKEAHELGIVHRDLKPANVMVDQKREPVVMDFGLARQETLTEGNQLTQSGMIVGTPAYMSPEQVRSSGKVGPSADIYSLGIIMYQLLTGRIPFKGDIVSVITKIVMESPPQPSSIRKEVHPRLEEICLKAIEKEPENRFQSMAVFAEHLTDFIKNPDANVTGLDKKQSANDEPQSSDLISPEESYNNETELGDEQQGTVTPSASKVIDSFFGTSSEGSTANSLPQPVPPPVSVSPTPVDNVHIDTVGAAQRKTSTAKNQNSETRTAGPVVPTAKGIGIPKWPIIVGVAAGLGAIAIVLSIILLIPTKDGIIRVEIDDPSINVTVNSTGFTIDGDDKSQTIKVQPGTEQSLKITRGDFEFETDTFTLRKGEKAVVKIEYVEGEVVALRDGKNIRLIPKNNNPDSTTLPVGDQPTETETAAVIDRMVNEGAQFEMENERRQVVNVSQNWRKVPNRVSKVNLQKVETLGDGDLAELVKVFPNMQDVSLDLSSVTANGLEPLIDSNIRNLFCSHPQEHDARIEEQIKTISQIKSVTGFHLRDCGVNDDMLRYFADCENLIFLDVRGLPIKGPGIRYLQKCPKLNELWLASGGRLQEGYIENVAGIEQLEGLIIRVDADSNLSSFCALKKLKRIEIWSHDPIKDLSPLADLPIEAIRLNHNIENHLGVFQSMKSLEFVNDLPVAKYFGDKDPPRGTSEFGRLLSRLKSLDTQITFERPPQNNQQNEKSLRIQDEVVAIRCDHREFNDEDLRSCIDTFPRLTAIQLHGTGISAAGLKLLENEYLQFLSIDVSAGGIGLREIGKLTKVAELEIYSCDIPKDDLPYLSGMQQLTSLSLERCTIHGPDLRHLRRLENLSDLNLAYTHIESDHLVDLVKHPELRRLSLNGCQKISDISFLRNSKIQHLHLNGTSVVDFLPLTDMSLVELILDDAEKHKRLLQSMRTLVLVNHTYKKELFENGKTSGNVVESNALVKRFKDYKVKLFVSGQNESQELLPEGEEWSRHRREKCNIIFPESHQIDDYNFSLLLDTFPNLFGLHLDISKLSPQSLLKLAETKIVHLVILSAETDEAQLESIGKAKQIEVLDMYKFPDVTDEQLRHFAGLKNLKQINLAGKPIYGPGIKHLLGLKNLTHLYLRNAEHRFDADSLQKLCEIEALEELSISLPYDADLGPFASLKNLENLEIITAQPLSDISPLIHSSIGGITLDYDAGKHEKTLRAMKTLELINRKPVKDFFARKEPTPENSEFFTRLRSMPILVGQFGQEYFPPDFDLEKNKQRIEVLRIEEPSGFNDEDLRRALQEFPLRVLLLRRTEITTEGLALLQEKELEVLGLDDNFTGENLKEVAKLSNVSELSFYASKIDDESLVEISKMRQLKALSLVSCPITGSGFVHLEQLTKLKILNLSRNPVAAKYLNSLAKIKSLETLELNDCKRINDLSGLKEMKLKEIEIQGTLVTDLSPLSEMPLHGIGLDYDAERDKKILRSIKTLKFINGKPVREFFKN